MLNEVELHLNNAQVKSEHNLTNFNSRVEHLHAVSGWNYEQIAAALEVSRTMLHYYRKGIHPPDAGVLLRLTAAEEKAGIKPPLARDYPLPTDGRTEGEGMDRQLRWLRGLLAQQLETVEAAQRHLREIAGWVEEAETRQEAATASSRPALGRRSKEKRARRSSQSVSSAEFLRDIDTVSLPIFGHLPAGWPQSREGVAALRPERSVPVKRGRFPEGAFGLEVRGESMNAATPRPILDGDIVVLLPPEQREPRDGDIVAALVDGETTLKRLVRKTRRAHLRSESHNPAFREIFPAHDLVIQGVLVGKL